MTFMKSFITDEISTIWKNPHRLSQNDYCYDSPCTTSCYWPTWDLCLPNRNTCENEIIMIAYFRSAIQWIGIFFFFFLVIKWRFRKEPFCLLDLAVLANKWQWAKDENNMEIWDEQKCISCSSYWKSCLNVGAALMGEFIWLYSSTDTFQNTLLLAARIHLFSLYLSNIMWLQYLQCSLHI